MLSVALNERTMCEDFDLKQEILFYKIGAEGLVSFHGKNFSRKVQLSQPELKQLTRTQGYFAISSNCYINVSRIKSIGSGAISFGGDLTSSKILSVSRRNELKLKQLQQIS